MYYPWVKVSGPDGRPLAVPPSGHLAGIYARSDTERGVHKAPANEVIRGALEAAQQITKGEQDTLNPVGVNCIRPMSKSPTQYSHTRFGETIITHLPPNGNRLGLPSTMTAETTAQTA